MNEELIAHLKELLTRVEACQEDLGPIANCQIYLTFFSTGCNSKNIASKLSDIGSVTYHKAKADDLAWHKGKIGKAVEITAFAKASETESSATSEVLEAVA